jgi:hypothetical protein
MKFAEEAPPSVEEAQHLLKQAQTAEKERKRLAAEERREAAREIAALRKAAAVEVAAVERTVDEAIDQAAAARSTPSRSQRLFARSWLVGQVPTGDLEPTASQVARGDRAAELLLGAVAAAGNTIQRLCNPMSDSGFLQEGHPEIRQLDEIECKAWAAFKARVRELAGE